ncbi:IS3 family transposase [Neofamilia massiliensis]
MIKEIERYIEWYNNDSIRTKLKGMSLISYKLYST